MGLQLATLDHQEYYSTTTAFFGKLFKSREYLVYITNRIWVVVKMDVYR